MLRLQCINKLNQIQNLIVFNVFSLFWSIFLFFDDFFIIQFLRKIKKQKSLIRKNVFSYLMNWDLGYLQSSVEENKIAIRKISIRSIRKLSYFDQQTIVGGPHSNLTNGEISIIFPSFFCKIHFSNNFIILLQFWLIF